MRKMPPYRSGGVATKVTIRFDMLLICSLSAVLILYGIVVLNSMSHLNRHMSYVPPHLSMRLPWHDRALKNRGADHDAVSSSSRTMTQVKFDLHLKDPDGVHRYHTPFPQSVSNEEWETIVHPAVSMKPKKSTTIDSDDPIYMTVPKFWNPHVFEPDVRSFLGNHGDRLITPEEASRIGSQVPAWESGNMLETIYIAISSYRDPRCTHTVEAIFQRAKFPERIRVAVVDQLDPDNDQPCIDPDISCTAPWQHVFCRHSNQIDVYYMDASLAVGPIFARHIGYRMYRGETYAMQTDAHMEFVDHWDIDLIDQWLETKNEMAVLTTYVSDVVDHYDENTHQRTTNVRPLMCDTYFVDDYYNSDLFFLQHGQEPEYEPNDVPGEPTLEPFWAAGFSFARGHFVVQVPYDQYLPMIFQGEEISLGIRGFTYGYDYYAPERSVLFHYYNSGPDQQDRKKVPTFWEHSDIYSGVDVESRKRMEGIIQMLPPRSLNDTNKYEGEWDWNHVDQKKYGLGNVRSVEKFLDTFGIHFAEKTVEANLCEFVGAPMHYMFTKHIRENKMGIDYDKIHYQFKDPKVYGETWIEGSHDVETF